MIHVFHDKAGGAVVLNTDYLLCARESPAGGTRLTFPRGISYDIGLDLDRFEEGVAASLRKTGEPQMMARLGDFLINRNRVQSYSPSDHNGDHTLIHFHGEDYSANGNGWKVTVNEAAHEVGRILYASTTHSFVEPPVQRKQPVSRLRVI